VISATDDGSGVLIALFILAVAGPLRRAGLIAHWLAALGLLTAAVRGLGARYQHARRLAVWAVLRVRERRAAPPAGARGEQPPTSQLLA
jgi:hypothetical protein